MCLSPFQPKTVDRIFSVAHDRVNAFFTINFTWVCVYRVCTAIFLFFCVCRRSLAWFLPCPLHSTARRCGIMLIPFETKIIILNNVKGHVHANPPRNYRHRANICQTAVPCEQWASGAKANSELPLFNFLSIISAWHWNRFNFFPKMVFALAMFRGQECYKRGNRIEKQNEERVSCVFTDCFYIKIWM